MNLTVGGTCIKSKRSIYAPHLVQPVRLHLFKRGGVTMVTVFPRIRWSWRRSNESYAARIYVNLRVSCYNGNNDRSARCCSFSTLGSRANDYVKTLPTLFTSKPSLRFWLHHSPCSRGCWTNTTLAARSLSRKFIGIVGYLFRPKLDIAQRDTFTKTFKSRLLLGNALCQQRLRVKWIKVK